MSLLSDLEGQHIQVSGEHFIGDSKSVSKENSKSIAYGNSK